MLYQQGDVLFELIDEVPFGAEQIKGDVLVEGEHTGHSHRRLLWLRSGPHPDIRAISG